MIRIALLALPLILPGAALAQLQSGPGAPAVSSQLPPSEPPGQSRPGPGTPEPAGRDAATGGDARTAPPGDHRVLGGPPVPGATQPQGSEGFATSGDPIPPRPGAAPDASTTGR